MPEPGRELERTLTLPGALTFNLLDMIGVGPFITLPLLMGAMGGPQAMLGWLLGALLAACDGLVWAELGAALPEAGGTYAYLQAMFPGRLGQWLSFLFIFQLCFSAPLSIASGGVGLAQYAAFLWPGLSRPWFAHTLQAGPYAFGIAVSGATLLAVAALGAAVVLQYRRLDHVESLSRWLLGFVLLTIGWTVLTALLHGHWSQAFAVPPHALRMNHAFFNGLGSAMLVATYDYWGYYNVSFLGAETRDPGRTIPRAVLLSIVIVALLYLVLNTSVLAVMGAPALLAMVAGTRKAMLSELMQRAWSGSMGAAGGLWMGRLAAVLVAVTAFASVFSLLLGYARIPFAAARDGKFFAAFSRLHRKGGFPFVSLLALAGVAALLTPFSLGDIVASLVVVRIVLQFALQHVGVMVLRRRRPDLPRPFRLWFYPFPPLLALAGFAFVAFSRPNFGREIWLAGTVLAVGSVTFAAWRLRLRSRQA